MTQMLLKASPPSAPVSTTGHKGPGVRCKIIQTTITPPSCPVRILIKSAPPKPEPEILPVYIKLSCQRIPSQLNWESFTLKSNLWGMYIPDYKASSFPGPFLRMTVGGITKCSNTCKSGLTAMCSEEGNILKYLSAVWSCQITSAVWSFKTI